MADMKTLTLGGKTFNIMDAEARAKAIPTVQVGGDTLTWDGNIGDRVAVDLLGDSSVFAVRASVAVPTIEELANGAVYRVAGQEINLVAIPQDQYIMLSNTATGESGCFIAQVDDAPTPFGEATFPKAGVYFMYIAGIDAMEVSLTIPGYTGFGEKKIDPAYLYQPDWNQNDETAADFIKNRPFYETTKLETFAEEIEITGADFGDGTFGVEGAFPPFPAGVESVKVVFDGTEYISKKMVIDTYDTYGNAAFAGGDDTGEPYLIMNMPEIMAAMYLSDSSKHIMSVYANVPVVNVIDEKLRPEPVLYWNVSDDIDGVSVSYVYTDAKCTVKATGEYVKRLVESNIGIILKMQQAFSMGDVLVGNTVGRNVINTIYIDEKYATLEISHGVKSDVNSDLVVRGKTLYTAEYVPPTT